MKKFNRKKIFSYERTDSKGRKKVVTLRKEDDEIYWIRICTYLSDNLKHKADYCKEANPNLFNEILKKEMKYLNSSESIRNLIAR